MQGSRTGLEFEAGQVKNLVVGIVEFDEFIFGISSRVGRIREQFSYDRRG